MRAVLRPEFVAAIAQRARKQGESVIFVHSHPLPMNRFSSIDDEGEQPLKAFLSERTASSFHAAMIVTPQTSIARVLGEHLPLKVLGVGDSFIFNGNDGPDPSSLYDRQIRAFGSHGQSILSSLRIGIVGLGGTGTVVLQSLAHLGVTDFLLIDPDRVETSNLNRLVGSTQADVGEPKVVVAERLAKHINTGIRIDAVQNSVLQTSVAHLLAQTDCVFCCTDSHGSRAVLNQLAYQYLVPVFDMGVVINVSDGKIQSIAGRTQLLSPGLACMVCSNLLDSEEVRRDLLSDFQRKADPYIVGAPEPAPAVISLNSTIASLAVTMFLSASVGVPSSARLLNYNAMTGACRPAIATPHPMCIVCSSAGALARGDEWPLPTRQD
jgi:molybdopterin/thiamine biosynthesis adenylyltransferase